MQGSQPARKLACKKESKRDSLPESKQESLQASKQESKQDSLQERIYRKHASQKEKWMQATRNAEVLNVRKHVTSKGEGTTAEPTRHQ